MIKIITVGRESGSGARGSCHLMINASLGDDVVVQTILNSGAMVETPTPSQVMPLQ